MSAHIFSTKANTTPYTLRQHLYTVNAVFYIRSEECDSIALQAALDGRTASRERSKEAGLKGSHLLRAASRLAFVRHSYPVLWLYGELYGCIDGTQTQL